MSRTLIVYDGVEYTVVGESPDELRRRIEAALSAQPVIWLSVNRGEGRRTPALLMVTPATPIAIIAEGSDRIDSTDPSPIPGTPDAII